VFSSKAFTYLDMHKDIVLDTLKNGCDFFIPFTSLGFIKLSPKTIGMLGVISSVAGLLVILEPRAKLLPA
jgi:peroxin-11B